MTLQEVLERIAWRVGSKTYLFCGDQEISYEGAVERTRKMAGALAGLGVGKGDRVGIFSINSMDYILAMFGIWNLGAIITTVDFRHAETMDYFVTDSGSKVLLFSQGLAEVVERKRSVNRCVEHYVCFDGPGDGVEGALSWRELVDAADPVRRDVADTDPCHLSYTSGSTGAPKGAVLAHEPTARATSCIAERLRMTQDMVTLGPTTLSSSQYLVANMLPGTTRGCTVGVMSDWDQAEAWRIIRERGVNILFANPLLLTDLYNEWRDAKLDKGPLRFTVSGGAPVPPDLKRVFQEEMKVPLVESYGMSELGGFVALGDPEPYDEAHFGAIGRILPDKDVIIGDDEDRELPIGQVGEILLRRGFMWGYWQMEEATARTLRNGWLHTSDLGRMDKQGYLYLVARKGDEIRWGKKTVYPRVVEEALYHCPAVQYTAVIGVPDEKMGEIPKAIVSCYPGKSATEEELRETIARELGAEEVPPVFEILDEMPMTATGKINKAFLKEREAKLRG
ncbi:MAG: class I adenylate-forming enzyme family protein [Nitrospinota bacterium]